MGDRDQRVPIKVAPPTRAALAAAATEVALVERTKCKVRQNIMQTIHGSRPPCARDKRISVRKFEGCQLWYPRHQIVSRKGVLHIQLCNHPAKCLNDVMTQFWHQRERMQGARWHTVLVPTRAHARCTLARQKQTWPAGAELDRHTC